MSSYQLYEKKYCNIQQIIPVGAFGALTVHHLPNKNYRRKKGGVSKLDHDKPTLPPVNESSSNAPELVTALQLHLAMRQAWPEMPSSPQALFISVEDKVTRDRSPVLEARLQAFRDYQERGRVLSDDDMEHIDLIEWEERWEKMVKDAERKERMAQRGT